MMRVRPLGDDIEDSLQTDNSNLPSNTTPESSGTSSVVPSGGSSFPYAGPQPPPGSYVDAAGRTILSSAFLAQQAALNRAAQPAAAPPWGYIAAGVGLLALVMVVGRS